MNPLLQEATVSKNSAKSGSILIEIHAIPVSPIVRILTQSLLNNSQSVSQSFTLLSIVLDHASTKS